MFPKIVILFVICVHLASCETVVDAKTEIPPTAAVDGATPKPTAGESVPSTNEEVNEVVPLPGYELHEIPETMEEVTTPLPEELENDVEIQRLTKEYEEILFHKYAQDYCNDPEVSKSEEEQSSCYEVMKEFRERYVSG